MTTIRINLIIFILFFPFFVTSQPFTNQYIRDKIQELRRQPKGPYQQILWFCPDGSTRQPKDRCPEKGGLQRGAYREDVKAITDSNHVYLGFILATTQNEIFWDDSHNHSLLKQYILQQYLRNVNEGWVWRRAQYYRGAIQAEDEEAWGIKFFNWLLANDSLIKSDYFLIRQAAKDIPHRAASNKLQKVRATSMAIADTFPDFMNLRIKIHGQPDVSDIQSVRNFKSTNEKKITPDLIKQFDVLIRDMEIVYSPINTTIFAKYLKKVTNGSLLKKEVMLFVTEEPKYKALSDKIIAEAELLKKIREGLLLEDSANRLVFIDISLLLEDMLFNQFPKWDTESVGSLLSKLYYLGMTIFSTGFIEEWEWNKISKKVIPPVNISLDINELESYLLNSRRIVEWGTGMAKITYKDVVDVYSGFEPLSNGFTDDRIRSSLLLQMGECVGELGEFIASKSLLSNHVFDIANQANIRGLNPGYAFGELVVINNLSENMPIAGDKIYIFDRPPSDLKPIAGIATVSEGNVVSHVQLLARNLGIPNAVLSSQNLEEIKKFNGQKVFYAVSMRGTVIMKTAEKMTDEEKKLFEVKKREEIKITISTDKIDLKGNTIINLRNVNASQSGILCGPKAANLGQLKIMFPDNVVEGLVIPFGIFRKHMDQLIPNQKISYWQFLNNVFAEASKMEKSGKSAPEIEQYVLKELSNLREMIKSMELLPEFKSDLQKSFQEVLGKNIGQIPVFVRSDTNMEDLKDFTGAGLNLTLFNIVTEDAILQGIKSVWASPYTERSYKWRQRYLLNPENVYPSILIIPSVNVDYSGVVITKNIFNGNTGELTVAFSRGAGGAVDGQAAETLVINGSSESELVSPSREHFYKSLPETGSTKNEKATLSQPILNQQNINEILMISKNMQKQLPELKGNNLGPYDIELGFKDNKLWLFQVRPFVENKNASGSAYLLSISPELKKGLIVNLEEKTQK
jgi:hypothetical protein